MATSEWVKLSEYKPYKDGWYLICCRHEPFGPLLRTAYYTTQGVWIGQVSSVLNKITHWMELPDPPAQEAKPEPTVTTEPRHMRELSEEVDRLREERQRGEKSQGELPAVEGRGTVQTDPDRQGPGDGSVPAADQPGG